MEGAGSRLGRVSSRYGPAPTFSGPVRKWKKQWVSYHNNNTTNSNNTHKLLLCRWTPLPSAQSNNNSGDQPKRKFRYTPIVVLEEKSKETAKQGGYEEAKTRKMNQSTESATLKTDDIFGKPIIDGAFMEETQASNKEQSDSNNRHLDLDLDLCLKGHDDDDVELDLDGENN